MAPVSGGPARAFDGGRVIPAAAAIAALGFVLLAVGLAVDPARTWLSYLTAFAAAVSVAVGALVFHMIGYAANSRWMAVTRRLGEAVVLSLPALALLFAPLVIGAARIYPWLTPAAPGSHQAELFAHRAAYLNLPGFAARGAVYFAIWIAAAALLRRSSIRRDRAGAAPSADPEAALGRERVIASVLLPLVGLALTFAAFDWIMSLEPEWYSSIFGIYYFAGGFLAALALITILAHRSLASGSLGGALSPNHFHALGRLLLGFVVLWAYAAFFQALLIRIANQPAEVSFYLERVDGAWGVFVYLLILGHFAVPFLALVPRRIKFRPRALAGLCGWILLMHLVDIYWLIIPHGAQGWSVLHWVDLGAFAAVFGSAVAFAAWRQRGVSLLAERDPFLDQGIAYRSPL